MVQIAYQTVENNLHSKMILRLHRFQKNVTDIEGCENTILTKGRNFKVRKQKNKLISEF